ncbi:unnamed protein product [Acanthoscelides obtectus]|uniref:Uncharacterized protein n=1 Tax=Acanthoscelides obtectus TaxID=200917 RepID=A0A9P0QDE3_ACAOB|nr:unnamed protein product [Acanthoscelides obtectus]CAK1682698.1 hypothetical protein AOBTE_LOCUS33804 [Acanthoscelides obtectus]
MCIRRRSYSFLLEYQSISIIKRWLIRAKERSKKSGAPFVVIKTITTKYQNWIFKKWTRKKPYPYRESLTYDNLDTE